MSDIRFNSLVFDRGIESISYTLQESMEAMPRRSEAPPPDIGVRAQLDQVLRQTSMNDRLDKALRPELMDRSLLSHRMFHAALRSVRKRLRESALQHEESSHEARTFNRAMRLLNEESSLRELVQMYRSSLYQG